MIPVSTITQEAKTIIEYKLKKIEKEHNIKIILAIESGSRAWGFPSINSDYDVRFIFVRCKNDYLSVKQQRDVFETDILHASELGVPLDLNGWDIRKALYLAAKSNAVLFEWLQSPIKYLSDDLIVADLMKFAQKAVSIDYVKRHYFKLMSSVFQQIKENDSVKLKLYCYALRPALSLKWLDQFGTVPPMDMNSLCKGVVNCTRLEKEISELIVLKENSQEKDIIPHNKNINSYIELMLEKSVLEAKKTVDEKSILEANIFFRKVIG